MEEPEPEKLMETPSIKNGWVRSSKDAEEEQLSEEKIQEEKSIGNSIAIYI